jgi:hypothetical protein
MITENPVHRKKAELIPQNKVLHEKLIPVFTPLVEKFPALHGTQWFICVHRSLSLASTHSQMNPVSQLVSSEF